MVKLTLKFFQGLTRMEDDQKVVKFAMILKRMSQEKVGEKVEAALKKQRTD